MTSACFVWTPVEMPFWVYNSMLDPDARRRMGSFGPLRNKGISVVRSIFPTLLGRLQERCGLSCCKYCSNLLYRILDTHTFNGPFSATARLSRYKKGETSLDFTEARDSEWQWHQMYHMQVCNSLQTDNHTSTPPLSSLQATCPSCRPTNSV